MKKIFATIMLVFVTVLVLENRSVSAGTTENSPNDKRITMHLTNQPLNEVFGRLTMDYDIAIGFEDSTLDNRHWDYRFETDIPFEGDRRLNWSRDNYYRRDAYSRPKVEDRLFTVDCENAPLAEVMNEIVRQLKYYTWEINDEVVNIYPTKGRNPSFEKLLSTRIAKFAVPAGLRIRDITRAVITLPEYQAFLRENSLSNSQQYASFTVRALSVAMEFSDLTVRDLLNAITKVKRGAWIMQKRSFAPNTTFVRLQL